MSNLGSRNKIRFVIIVVLLFMITFPYIPFLLDKFTQGFDNLMSNQQFRIISSTSNQFFDEELKEFSKKEKLNISIDYYGDLEIIDILNSSENDYDAVWISNSIWLYMLDNSYLVTNSKSIAINPVIMGIRKSKAQELGFINNEVYNRDILTSIKEQKLKYVMTSVTKTNTGATAYLGFLNSLAGSPEVLKSEMLQDKNLIENMKSFFKGVERVSGDESFLSEMFLSGNYEAMINYESSLIELNKKLISENKEPLYLVYPKDGVAINDMPFGYVDRGQSKKEKFDIILKYLRSKEIATSLEQKGLRTWYGGTKANINKEVFNSNWGIDTTKYLMPLKYPSKKVITEALDLYIDALRKPTHTVFCLDVSGSMQGHGLTELQDAMNYILDKSLSSKDRLQFSSNDKITVITFNSNVQKITNTFYGNNTGELISYINKLYVDGGTNIYSPSVEALKILENENRDEYTTTVILMTDGNSNSGSLSILENYYHLKKLDIPIYSIMFGSSNESQLNGIANLTNGKVFDGKDGLKEAFKEVRSYN